MRLRKFLNDELNRQKQENDLRDVEIYGKGDMGGIYIMALTYDRGLTNIDWLASKVLNAKVLNVRREENNYGTDYNYKSITEDVVRVEIDLECAYTYY